MSKYEIRPEKCDGHYFETLPGGGDVIQARCTSCGMRATFTPEQWEELKDA